MVILRAIAITAAVCAFLFLVLMMRTDHGRRHYESDVPRYGGLER